MFEKLYFRLASILLLLLGLNQAALAWNFNPDSHISNVKIDKQRGVLTFSMVVYHEIRYTGTFFHGVSLQVG